jgi:hypothetical protein
MVHMVARLDTVLSPLRVAFPQREMSALFGFAWQPRPWSRAIPGSIRNSLIFIIGSNVVPGHRSLWRRAEPFLNVP